MPRPIRANEVYSYNEWQDIGYQVQRDERHVARNHSGVPLFSAAQVRPRTANTMAHTQGFQQRPRRMRNGGNAPVERVVDSSDYLRERLQEIAAQVDRAERERQLERDVRAQVAAYERSIRQYFTATVTPHLPELQAAYEKRNQAEHDLIAQRLTVERLENELLRLTQKQIEVPTAHSGLARLSHLQQVINQQRRN